MIHEYEQIPSPSRPRSRPPRPRPPHDHDSDHRQQHHHHHQHCCYCIKGPCTIYFYTTPPILIGGGNSNGRPRIVYQHVKHPVNSTDRVSTLTAYFFFFLLDPPVFFLRAPAIFASAAPIAACSLCGRERVTTAYLPEGQRVWGNMKTGAGKYLLRLNISSLAGRHFGYELCNFDKELLASGNLRVGLLPVSVEETHSDPSTHRRPLCLIVSRVPLVLALDTALREDSPAHLLPSPHRHLRHQLMLEMLRSTCEVDSPNIGSCGSFQGFARSIYSRRFFGQLTSRISQAVGSSTALATGMRRPSCSVLNLFRYGE